MGKVLRLSFHSHNSRRMKREAHRGEQVRGMACTKHSEAITG